MVSPRAAARWLFRIWFWSPRFPEPAREARYRQSARAESLAYDPGPISVYLWGEGPGVLLIHGWSGRGAQLGAFIEPLVRKGYRVIAFDAPGHGRSPGHGTDAFMVTDIVTRLEQAYGPFHGIIGHSFGALCTVMSLARGVVARKAVTLSSPTQLPWLLEGFFKYMRLTPRTIAAFRRLAERQYGTDVWQQTSADFLAPNLAVPCLIVHDRDDRDVACRQSELLATAWPGSELLITQGLGHRRILRDEKVIAAVCDFITT